MSIKEQGIFFREGDTWESRSDTGELRGVSFMTQCCRERTSSIHLKNWVLRENQVSVKAIMNSVSESGKSMAEFIHCGRKASEDPWKGREEEEHRRLGVAEGALSSGVHQTLYRTQQDPIGDM